MSEIEKPLAYSPWAIAHSDVKGRLSKQRLNERGETVGPPIPKTIAIHADFPSFDEAEFVDVESFNR